MQDTHIETIMDLLQVDDDLQPAREYLAGAKDKMKMTKDNIKDMMKRLYMKNDEFIPFKVSVETPYKMKIPIGTVCIGKEKSKTSKASLYKFYISKIWRINGHEEKTLLETLRFCFKTLKCDKIESSAFTSNKYFLQLLLGLGFRFNQQDSGNNNPDQRVSLWLYKK